MMVENTIHYIIYKSDILEINCSSIALLEKCISQETVLNLANHVRGTLYKFGDHFGNLGKLKKSRKYQKNSVSWLHPL